MTLIASIKAGDSPVLLADRLLTSSTGMPDVFLPTIGDNHVQVSMDSGARVHDLARKVTIITPNILVAWAGNVACAMRVLHGVKHAAEKYAEEISVIQNHLKAEYSADLKHVCIIVHHRQKSGVVDTWTNGNGCKVIKTEGIEIWYAGSGAEMFADMIRQTNPAGIRQLHPRMQAANMAVSIAANFLAVEITSSGTLKSRFGGFYDFLLFQKNGPVWIYDVTYVFWHIKKVGDKYPINMPSKFIKHIDLGNYKDVAVYSAELGDAGAGKIGFIHESYSVSSSQCAALISGRRNEPLKTVWQAVVFIVESNGRFRSTSHVSCHPDTNGHLLEIDRTENGAKMSFDLSMIHQVVTPLIRAFEGT